MRWCIVGVWTKSKEGEKTGNKVTYYTRAIVDINFPENHVCCDLCPLMETYARKQCRRTGEYLLDSRTIGIYCPLKFEEGEK